MVSKLSCEKYFWAKNDKTYTSTNKCEINFYPNLFIQVLNGNQSRTPVSSAYNYEKNNYFKNLCD